MKARHMIAIAVVSGFLFFGFLSCNLSSVSIDQRISTFQSDLNTQDRSSLYLNFYPGQTSEYDALKNPSATNFNLLFPLVTSTNYSLTVTDESNPSAGVRVTVNAGPSSPGVLPYYLLLVMGQYSGNDWRIISISISTTYGTYPSPVVS
jgi:hypothetical protein